MELSSYEWVAWVLGAMKILEIIARLTPTQRDNNVLEMIRRLAAVLGVAVPDVKEK